jgi:hypothetical protein
MIAGVARTSLPFPFGSSPRTAGLALLGTAG